MKNRVLASALLTMLSCNGAEAQFDPLTNEMLASVKTMGKYKDAFSKDATYYPNCSDQNWSSIEAAIKEIKDATPETTRLANANIPHAIELANSLAGIQLIWADRALEHKCLDIADKLYRGVIITYTGADLAAIRQRAQIGIDDVRSKRK